MKVSVLAFEKKLVPSDGYLYSTKWEDRATGGTPLKIREKSVRGTISNRLKAAVKNDPAKLNAKVEKPNLQTVDACALGTDDDTLIHQFNLKILGGIDEPSACNNAEFRKSLQHAAQSYVQREGFKELARRYAINIANARFLWRNRVGAESIEVYVSLKSGNDMKSWQFDAYQFSMAHFDDNDTKVNELAAYIADALAGQSPAIRLDIRTAALIGNAQEVYPSEELVLEKGEKEEKGEKRKKGKNNKKSKVLYDVDGQAAMHSQKIGNALRTIDTWYPGYGTSEVGERPIAIEPYGAVTNLGVAYRTPKGKHDFYSKFDRWACGQNLETTDEHFVIAILVRGGVFGDGEE